MALYHSLIELCFTFNDFIYDPMTEQAKNKLQVLQNNCLRTCLHRGPLSHRADLFSDSGVLPLDVQRKVHTSHFVNRALNQESTTYLNDLYTRASSVTERMTCSTIQGKLYIPKCRTQCASDNIRVRGENIYNQIPLPIRESTNFNAFKRNMKREIPFISKYI